MSEDHPESTEVEGEQEADERSASTVGRLPLPHGGGRTDSASSARAVSELNAAFEALASERRRIAMRALIVHHSLALADLAEVVAEEETGTRIANLSAGRVADTYLSLYHQHVKKLEDANMARYDQGADGIVATDELRAVVGRLTAELASLTEEGAVSSDGE